MSLRSFPVVSVERVVDGDTLDLLIDLGFHTYTSQRVRLMGIDTPECRSTDLVEKHYGLLAKQVVEEICHPNKHIEFKCPVDKYRDKFGRVTGELWVNNTNINTWLCENAYAVEYDGHSNRDTLRQKHEQNRIILSSNNNDTPKIP